MGLGGKRQFTVATTGNGPVSYVQEAGWAAGPVSTGAEYLAQHRDSIPGPSSP